MSDKSSMPLRRKIFYLLGFILLSLICGLGVLFLISFVEMLDAEENSVEYDQIRWSPDGQYIAFQIWSDYLGRTTLYVADVNTLQLVEIADNNPRLPAWSPDSRQIVFISPANAGYAVHIVNIDGSGLRNLTPDGESQRNPILSPDGEQIAFNFRRYGRWQLYVMRVNGSDIRQLTPFSAGRAAWSSDGSRIVFSGRHHLNSVDVETGEITRLTSESGSYGSPIWSPDGSRIAFVGRQEGAGDLYVMDADGSDMTRLASGLGLVSSPLWSPDSSRIALSNLWNLYVVNVEDGTLIEFDRPPNSNIYWHPSGEQLLTLVVHGDRVDSPKTIESYDLSSAS